MQAKFSGLLAALIVMVLTVTTGLSIPPEASAAQPGEPDGAPADTSPRVEPGEYNVTLLTGDEVTVSVDSDGRVETGVVPADRGGTEVDFEMLDTEEDVYVLPGDAVGLIPEQLDLELFNVTKLAAYGYHAAGMGTLPVIISNEDGPRLQDAVPAAAQTRGLPAIDAVAAEFDAESAADFWSEAVEPEGPSTPGVVGIDTIVLDELVEVELEDSVPQIGAPTAWDAGYDGTDTTIAILDTGIDADHPDFADGQVIAEENFTTDDSAADGHGHGTHVGATAAGVGGDGGLTGVAPGAELVNTKVLNDEGSGQESWIIDGMTWVAEEGYEVANMSLGGGVTDGSDPISEALDTLTEDYDTSFVVSSGNIGTAGVTAPGTASSALTVGAVDKDGALASFSSRGPREGDYAIKPDITAPGVEIVAARADGTSMGEPVDDLYTSANGTSMAAPHVAGAAAILAQQHPDWDQEQLKSALTTTAVPNDINTVYEQGGGLADLAAAVETPVLATPAPLDLGYFPYPHDDAEPVSHGLTYTNISDEEITLDVTFDVTDEDGNAPAEGMLGLDTGSVTIAAGASETVTITVDPAVGDYGIYGGYLGATGDDHEAVTTPVGFHKESERYDLTIDAIDTRGLPADGGFTIMNVDDQDQFFDLTVNLDEEGFASRRVPPGTYAVYGFVNTHPEGETFATVRTAVADPEFDVDDDVELVFDARTANEITVDTTQLEHDVEPRERTTLYMARRPVLGTGANRSVHAFPDATFQVEPTDPITKGTFGFFNRWELADPEDPIDSDVLYDVVFAEEDVLPDDVDYVINPDDMAVSNQRFHTHVPEHLVREFRNAWQPWQGSSLAFAQDVPASNTKTDYLTSADTQWSRNVLLAPPTESQLAARMNMPRTEYQPGEEETRDWYKQPVTPGMIEGTPWHDTFPQTREGDILDLFVAEFADSTPGHWSWYSASIDDADFRLYADDELIAEADRPQGEFELPAERSTIRMEADVSREGFDWWGYSTHTSTAWEFDSESTTEVEEIPFLLIDYDLELDLLNQLPHPRDVRGPQTLDLTVRHQPGFDDAPDIEGARLWISDDDGDRWRPVGNLRPIGDGEFRAQLNRGQRDADALSVRVEAWDASDNRIEQEIIRAFGVPDLD